jgi:hypothetical protein
MTTLIPKFEQTGVTTVNRPISEKLAEWVSVKDFGAVGDGIADDTAAIQAALDSSVTAAVYFPAGAYKLTACLNNTNGYRSLVGPGGSIAVTLNSTSTDYIIDNTGTNWGVIEGIQFSSNSARVGVYYNRSATAGFEYCQNNVLRNCRFELGTNTAANGGLGRVCYYNRSAELNLIENCQFRSDTPVMVVAATNPVFLPIYTTEGSIVSMTCVEFNKCVIFSNITDNYALWLSGVATINFTNCYIGSGSGDAVANKPAIIATVMDGCRLDFHIEAYTQAMIVTSICQGSTLQLYMQHSSTLGTIWLENGNSALSSFVGNNVEIKTGGSASSNNVGVRSTMNQNLVYIASNNVNVCGGTLTPIFYTATIIQGTSNTSNLETSPNYTQLNNCQQTCFYGADVQNGVSLALTISGRCKLVKITMGFAVRNGSSDYHNYQYTIPVWAGTAQYVASVSLGASGSNNDFTYTLVGNLLTISTSAQLGSGTAVYEVTEYFL